MKDEDDSHSSTIWSKYVEAKQAVFGPVPDMENNNPLTIEELELAIAEVAASSGYPEIGMPPRSVVHPTKQHHLSRWFYLCLVVLFLGLIVGLVWWGREQIG